jgi:2-succinyl-5-enolpyruvyl-6-hydroxy-3-cyclohexene-1-carboxylate synthase
MTSIIPFQQLANLCVQKGIQEAIICPGSRNAALTIAFTSNKSLHCISISDERSAGFIALGKAIATNKPTVLICTSGTAALNFHPAVAEAYFQKIPLLVITADRPPEWIHQHDGQTVFQAECFGKHVNAFYQWLPDQSEESIQFAARVSNEAINRSFSGPIHVNIPIREPFYPKEIKSDFPQWRNVSRARIVNHLDKDSKKEFLELVKTSKSRLLVVGQNRNIELGQKAIVFGKKYGFEVVSDGIGNVSGGVKNHEIYLKTENTDDLHVDFLLTVGQSLISKSLKSFLRNNKAINHWHIEKGEELIDPFLSITKKLDISPDDFFNQLFEEKIECSQENKWSLKENLAFKQLKSYFSQTLEFSDFSFLYQFVNKLPDESIIHLGNSMSVRYMNSLNAFLPKNTTTFSNRGTSGIEGTLSTAVGHAMHTSLPVYCILGDVSFQYDKNALWNNYLPSNLKIIILNNAGGVIFQMIKGPAEQDSFGEFFRTKQEHKADLIAREYGLTYISVQTNETIIKGLSALNSNNKATILEVFTDPDIDESVYKSLFKK